MARHEKCPFTLTPRERLILSMYEAGMSMKEIAESLGIADRSSVSRAIYIARDKLRAANVTVNGPIHYSSLSKARGKVRMTGTK